MFNRERLAGFTGALSKAGFGVGTTPEEIGVVAPNGAGIDFAIDGVAYHYADDASVASVPAVTLATQAASTSCLWLIQITAAGVISMKKGDDVLNTDIAAETKVLQWPEPDADNCPVGGVKLVLTGTAWVPDVDSFAEAWVTDTWYDFAGGIPGAPLTS